MNRVTPYRSLSWILAIPLACSPAASLSVPDGTVPTSSPDDGGSGGAGQPPTGQTDRDAGSGGADSGTSKFKAVVPSDVPQVVSSGGAVLASPKIVPVFFSGDDTTTTTQLANFVSTVGASDYWKKITAEYGVGPAAGAPPITVAEHPGSDLKDVDIRKWLGEKLDNDDPAFGKPDENTLYVIFYPAGVTVTKAGLGTSCQQFGGYHEDVVLDAAHGSKPIAYAVIPRCDGAAGLHGIDEVTGLASHEILEAVTDPYPNVKPAYIDPDGAHIVWSLFEGGELGDMCDEMYGKFGDLAFTVQRGWSNAEARVGHDPCLPTLGAGPYFNAEALFEDDVTLSIGSKTFAVKGLKLAEGESKTVELKLFSDAPTSSPWTLSAIDQAAGGGQPAELGFAFDPPAGQNGDKVKMTVTVLHASTTKFEPFVIFSTLGSTKNHWVGVVAQ